MSIKRSLCVARKVIDRQTEALVELSDTVNKMGVLGGNKRAIVRTDQSGIIIAKHGPFF